MSEREKRKEKPKRRSRPIAYSLFYQSFAIAMIIVILICIGTLVYYAFNPVDVYTLSFQ